MSIIISALAAHSFLDHDANESLRHDLRESLRRLEEEFGMGRSRKRDCCMRCFQEPEGRRLIESKVRAASLAAAWTLLASTPKLRSAPKAAGLVISGGPSELSYDDLRLNCILASRVEGRRLPKNEDRGRILLENGILHG